MVRHSIPVYPYRTACQAETLLVHIWGRSMELAPAFQGCPPLQVTLMRESSDISIASDVEFVTLRNQPGLMVKIS